MSSARQTRSQTGKTPKKPSHLADYVETPGTYRRTRKSLAPISRDGTVETEEQIFDRIEVAAQAEAEGKELAPTVNGSGSPNGAANGHSNGTAKRGRGRPKKEAGVMSDPKVDDSGEFEFAGTPGVTLVMIGFPIIMYIMWIGVEYYDGHIPWPTTNQSWSNFVQQFLNRIVESAYPTAKAWAIYWVFFVVQGIFYLYMPGVYGKGKPLEHEGGKQLDYYCSAVWSWYTTIVLAFVLHFTGIFKIYTLIDEFGPLMSVAILSGILVSIVAYFSAIARGAQHRMTGHHIYDFFMGAELNPRLLGWLDFKMFFEVRLPWFILFMLSLGAALKQYEDFGKVTPEVCFVLMAHFIYANACAKGEELIITTWDMYFEKWGFMLIFWNMAGVPLSYCHCTLYLAKHDPSEYAWSTPALVAFFSSYLFVYWVWDTCNSQKNMFRARQRGHALTRKTFPQLPWKEVKDPVTIPTETGDDLLADGWYGKARKIHYSCDIYFATTWALICGFKSPFPWFYPTFFCLMIVHRAWRDITRCREKYGKAWEEYERRVPYIFIPYVF